MERQSYYHDGTAAQRPCRDTNRTVKAHQANITIMLHVIKIEVQHLRDDKKSIFLVATKRGEE